MYARIKRISNAKTKTGTTVSNKVAETKNKLSFMLRKPSYIPTQSKVTEVTASGEIPLTSFVKPEVTFVSTFNSHPEKVRNLLRELDSYSTIDPSGTLSQSELELYRISPNNFGESQNYPSKGIL